MVCRPLERHDTGKAKKPLAVEDMPIRVSGSSPPLVTRGTTAREHRLGVRVAPVGLSFGNRDEAEITRVSQVMESTPKSATASCEVLLSVLVLMLFSLKEIT